MPETVAIPSESLVAVTEAAAVAAAVGWLGRGERKRADGAAVTAMRRAFEEVAIDGVVVIGEGAKDEAPELYVGERVGAGGPKAEIAVDPLEGTDLCAQGRPNSIAILAVAEPGVLFSAPDTYMHKVACGPLAAGAIDIDASPGQNVRAVAEAHDMPVEDVTVVVLDRPRHEGLINEVRGAGARVVLIQDGDIAASISAATGAGAPHLYLGTGGSTEGVIAAAALRQLGGDFQGRMAPRTTAEADVIRDRKLDGRLPLERLCAGPAAVVATGVSDGDLLRGVRRFGGGHRTHSLLMDGYRDTVRFVDTIHLVDRGVRTPITL
jgi:fructose-1,6-bisphosphatase II